MYLLHRLSIWSLHLSVLFVSSRVYSQDTSCYRLCEYHCYSKPNSMSVAIYVPCITPCEFKMAFRLLEEHIR
jgi:hypothetical protein